MSKPPAMCPTRERVEKNCNHCGGRIWVRPRDLRAYKTHYCDRYCYREHKHKQAKIARLQYANRAT